MGATIQAVQTEQSTRREGGVSRKRFAKPQNPEVSPRAREILQILNEIFDTHSPDGSPRTESDRILMFL
jgi:hypothetical protein